MVEMKKCSRCNQLKELENFKKSKSERYGYQNVCKDCIKESARKSYHTKKEYNKAYRRRDDVRYRRYIKNIEFLHGITEEWLRDKQDEQKGMCAICGSSLVNPIFHKHDCVIDHDHDTEERRGLLCSSCNTAFGLLEEDRDRIINMINYLDKWEQ